MPKKKIQKKKKTSKSASKKKAVKKKSRKKRTTQKTVDRKKKQKEKLAGKITHFYSKIKVAVVKLQAPLKVGDKIKIKGGETEFQQTVKSMEIDHKKVQRVPKGKEIGLKVSKKVREGYKVYKL